MLGAARALPGVLFAGVGTVLPPHKPPVTIGIRYVGEGRDTFQFFKMGSGTPGFLRALGVRFLRGRDFTDADAAAPAGTAILSEAAARHLFGAQDPVGRQVNRLPPLAGPPQPVVVGVVSDVKYDGLDVPAAGAVYVPWTRLAAGTSYVVVKAHDPHAVMPALHEVIRREAPAAPAPAISTVTDSLWASVASRQVRAAPAAALAVLSLLMTLAGIVATVSQAAGERRREFAIRAALGAPPGELLTRQMRESATAIIVGAAVGLPLALVTGRWLGTLLYGVSAADPRLLATTAAIVAGTACLATYLPARHAHRPSPRPTCAGSE